MPEGTKTKLREIAQRIKKKETFTGKQKEKKKKTFGSPMKMERKKEGYRSKAEKIGSKVKFADEMDAMTKGLDTLTSKGPGKVKVGSFAKGGRIGLKAGSKGCKLAMKGKGKAYGKNS